MKFFLYLAVISFALAACDSSRVFEENRDFNDRTWKANDTVVFVFSVDDVQQRYNLYCNIRNSIDYPFARMFVRYALKDSLNNELSQKLISEYLFDAKTGEPLGNSGLGDLYDHRFLLLKDYQFNRPGKYFVHLLQFMREDSLKGVLAAGLRVEKSQK